jgi:DNA polymerase-3 subunit delta
MIIKNFELEKLKSTKVKKILFYGENEGYKNQIINNFFITKFSENFEKYEENQILNNYEDFFSSLLNKSFFEKDKLLIINRASDKILKLVEEISSKNIDDVTLVINSGTLEKKSKLRKFFEKEINTICVPFYNDENKTLNSLAYNFLNDKKISLSQEMINIIVERSSGDRQNLYNELIKLENYQKNGQKITIEHILKISNLAQNYSVSELVNNCLSKNLKKTINILNENNYSSDDCILILRTLLSKSKRLLKIKESINNNMTIDQAISYFKPPIFWKDKEFIKKQISAWTLKNIQKLIYKINSIELLSKKNNISSLFIVSDFILESTQ